MYFPFIFGFGFYTISVTTSSLFFFFTTFVFETERDAFFLAGDYSFSP
jgi:hypothetical protein